MSLNYLNIPLDINVIDFKISNIAEPVLSSDFTKVTLVFTGVANPENSDVSLITYQYSLDNGVTWFNMTTSSDLEDLDFTPVGLPYNFVWAIKEDIGNSIYNIPIKIRFEAQATFGSDILQTAYKLKTITIVKTVIIPEANVPPIFPADYTGVSIQRKKPIT